MEVSMTQDSQENPSQYGPVFTIEHALQLMKELPLEGMNEKLVIDVMRMTLEKAGVDIAALIQLANERENEITNEIMRLQGEIASLNEAIQEKTAQVAAYQEHLGEVSSLRERFEE